MDIIYESIYTPKPNLHLQKILLCLVNNNWYYILWYIFFNYG